MQSEEFQHFAGRAAAGDMEALEALCRGMHEHLLCFLYVLGVRHSEVDDAAQDVALKMYEALDRYDPRRPFLPWLRGVARHVAIQRWQARARDEERLAEFRDYVHGQAIAAQEGERFPDFRMERLEQCLKSLTSRQREILDLRYTRTLDSGTIAKCVKLRPQSVRKALFRIREMLRRCMLREEVAQEGS